MKYHAQTAGMFLLKYLDWKKSSQNTEVQLSEMVGDLKQLQNKKGLDMYIFPQNEATCSKALLADLYDLENEGLVMSVRRSEPRYQLSPLGEYFCLLIETPQILKG